MPTPRLPGGDPRKASQKRARRPRYLSTRPIWRSGAKVRWQFYSGIFLHDLGDGEHVDIVIADRIYRVRIGDLRRG